MQSAALRTDLIHALDPVTFVHDVTGFEPDPWQAEVLRSDADRLILNCSRQSGKSTIAGLLALHTAIYSPGSLILLLSPSLRQSSELFQGGVHRVYGAIAEDHPARRESALRLELRNGSRIVSLPGKEGTVRGYAGVSLLIVDEASRVPDDLFHAISPMLAVSNGRLVLLSTPFGKRGIFFSTWDTGDDWQKIQITAEQCPRISADFLKRERKSMPRWFYAQEYECSFEESQAAVFDWSAIEEAAKGKVKTWRV